VGVCVGVGLGVTVAVGTAADVAVGPGLGVPVGPVCGVPVGPGRGVAVTGCAVAVAVAVGVLVAELPKPLGCVTKRAITRMAMISTASIPASHHFRFELGSSSIVVVVLMDLE
jgi:hypothetical protein